MVLFFLSSRRRHTRCALVTGVQTCAPPIYAQARPGRLMPEPGVHDAQITGHVDADGQFAQYRGVERPGWSNTVRAASTTSSTRRSEERSVGNECVSQCRSRGCPLHATQKPKTNMS